MRMRMRGGGGEIEIRPPGGFVQVCARHTRVCVSLESRCALVARPVPDPNGVVSRPRRDVTIHNSKRAHALRVAGKLGHQLPALERARRRVLRGGIHQKTTIILIACSADGPPASAAARHARQRHQRVGACVLPSVLPVYRDTLHQPPLHPSASPWRDSRRCLRVGGLCQWFGIVEGPELPLPADGLH